MTSRPDSDLPDDRPGDAPAADLVRGVAPIPSAVPDVDWSGSAAEAAVGRLLHTAHAVDRMTARLVDDLVAAVESGATEEALGVAVELVLSQSGRMVSFERATLLRAVTALVAMPATRQAFREQWIKGCRVGTLQHA